ncbi:MAG: hypothetical protein OEV59_07990 [Deltaproteobacteria bacterium]|nr:hypothetical protein [Deltaproteobacteria bacterium]
MADIYIKERQTVYDTLARSKDDFVHGRFWILDPGTIRFRHGEHVAELKIPYHLGADDEGIVEAAVQELVSLIKRRHEAVRPEAAGASITFDDAGIPGAAQSAVQQKRPLMQETLKGGFLLANSVESAISSKMPCFTPLVDSDMLAVWFSKEGSGKKYIDWIAVVLDKAMKDESTVDIGEVTSYLALLAIINGIRKYKDKLKDARIKGISYDRLDIAVGFALYGATRGAVWALFDKVREHNAHYYNPFYEAVIKGAVVPKAFVAIQGNTLASVVNPYGLNDAITASIAANLGSYEGEADAASTVRTIADIIKKDKELGALAKSLADINALRDSFYAYLLEFDIAGDASHKALREACVDDRGLKAVMEGGSDKLVAVAAQIKNTYLKDVKRAAALDKLTAALVPFSKSSGAFGWLLSSKKGSGVDADAAALDTAERFFAYWIDEKVHKLVEAMRLHMEDRRASGYADAMLIEEYKKGRIYRFSKDLRSILAPMTFEFEGQLFVDMKDFTTKTRAIKEIAMAEYMKENFYTPILDAAFRYNQGAGLREVDSGIRLNSLPGDAAIFSGPVSQLVSLASDIHRVLWLYKERIEKKLPEAKGSLLQMKDIHKNYEAKMQAIAARRNELSAKLKAGDTTAGEAIARLDLEQANIGEMYREALEKALLVEMQAGVFITFGAKAETMTIPPRQGLSQTVSVAISEKINEASRGTGRNSAVRAKIEILLEKERKKRMRPEFVYPFDIYIDTLYTLKIPPEIEQGIGIMREKRDQTVCKDMATLIARECYSDLIALAGGAQVSALRLLEEKTDIYNKGQALSKDAMMAYVSEMKGKKFFFQRVMSPLDLHSDIRDNFFIPYKTLEFWISCESRDRAEIIEVFRKAGEITFKGFESAKPTEVFELLNRDSQFTALLIAKHVRPWIEEARKRKML